MPPKNELLISINGDPQGVNKALDSVQSRTEKLESGLKKAAAISGAAFIGLTGAIGVAVNAFKQQEQAQNQLNAVLKSTGGAAGLTADEIQKLAQGLQDVTTFGDEAILESSKLLLTFKEIGGDVFPRAQKAILDVSAGLNQGLKESAIQVGKALNDPIQGVTALRRVGVQLTAQQEEQIKSFVELGNVAAAQGIILTELESQFGGQAEAAAQGLGVLNQLRNSFGDLLEVLGAQFAPIVGATASILNTFVQTIRDNEKAVKLLALAVGVGAAGAGLVFSFSSLGLILIKLPALLAAIKVGFLAITGPVGLIVAGVAALIATFSLLIIKWDEVNAGAVAVFTFLGEFFSGFVLAMKTLFGGLGNIIKGVFTLNPEEVVAGFTAVTNGVIAVSKATAVQASAAFTQAYTEDLAARKDQVGNGLDQIVGKVREFASNQFSVLKQSADNIFTLNTERNESLIQSEIDFSDEIATIDAALGQEQVAIYDDTTSQLLAASSARNAALAQSAAEGAAAQSAAAAGTGQITLDLGAIQALSPIQKALAKNAGAFSKAAVEFAEQEFIRKREEDFFRRKRFNETAGIRAEQERLRRARELAEEVRKAIDRRARNAAIKAALGMGAIGLGFQHGKSGAGRDRIPARLSPGEIVVPENFSEGIRRGRFALVGNNRRGMGMNQRIDIAFRGSEANRILTARVNADRALRTRRERAA